MDKDTIKNLRTSLNMNQGQFSKIVGVSFSTVSRWETGDGTPNDTQIEQLESLEQLSSTRDIDNVKLKQNLLNLGIAGTLVAAVVAGIAITGPRAGAIAGFLNNTKDLLNLFKKE